MYKKILSVILAGLMLVSFAGCSNKEADKSESNELVLFNAKWSYVKKKYKLNTTNFLFLCNC